MIETFSRDGAKICCGLDLHTYDEEMLIDLLADNWDLSVLRATAIVRILTKNKGLSSKIISASGKGPYSPLFENSSPENRASNRRIEIILSPDIDGLIQLLEID